MDSHAMTSGWRGHGVKMGTCRMQHPLQQKCSLLPAAVKAFMKRRRYVHMKLCRCDLEAQA